MGWLGPMTDWQFRVWLAWLDMEWNRPSRTDHYLMRIAQRCHQGWVKHPGEVDLDAERVEFGKKDAEQAAGGDSESQGPAIRKMSPELQAKVASQLARAAWKRRMSSPQKDSEGGR